MGLWVGRKLWPKSSTVPSAPASFCSVRGIPTKPYFAKVQSYPVVYAVPASSRLDYKDSLSDFEGMHQETVHRA